MSPHFASACCTSFSGATTHQPPSAAISTPSASWVPSTSIARRNDWVPSTCDAISDICSRRGSLPPAQSRCASRRCDFCTSGRRSGRTSPSTISSFPRCPISCRPFSVRKRVVRLIDAAPNRLYRILLVLLYATRSTKDGSLRRSWWRTSTASAW